MAAEEVQGCRIGDYFKVQAVHLMTRRLVSQVRDGRGLDSVR